MIKIVVVAILLIALFFVQLPTWALMFECFGHQPGCEPGNDWVRTIGTDLAVTLAIGTMGWAAYLLGRRYLRRGAR